MKYHFMVSGEDLAHTGKASTEIKKILARLGVAPENIRRIAIVMYEGETNLAIHAGGGEVDVDISSDRVEVILEDHGPGIPDLELAMSEGYSTAPEWIREQGFGAGMGLSNMKKNADGFDVATKVGQGTRIVMVISLTNRTETEGST